MRDNSYMLMCGTYGYVVLLNPFNGETIRHINVPGTGYHNVALISRGDLLLCGSNGQAAGFHVSAREDRVRTYLLALVAVDVVDVVDVDVDVAAAVEERVAGTGLQRGDQCARLGTLFVAQTKRLTDPPCVCRATA